MDSVGCSSVCGDILSCWDWLFLCYYILLQYVGYFTGSNLYVSQGLFTVVSIMSSAAKVTPQFLGQLCLVKNMGIDQQVVHYVHPLAVMIIVGMICLLARMS